MRLRAIYLINNIKLIKNIMTQIEAYEAQAKEEIGGQPMNFKLSDNQKYILCVSWKVFTCSIFPCQRGKLSSFVLFYGIIYVYLHDKVL